MEELHLKNSLIILSVFLSSTNKSIRDISLIEYQQRLWSQIDCLWDVGVRQQDRAIQQITIKTYRGKPIDDLERWY